jgi:hypothetical protein
MNNCLRTSGVKKLVYKFSLAPLEGNRVDLK